MPNISVIMACHNADSYVTDAINSVLGQTFSDFELVFVDDCSSDRSLEFATMLSKEDARIRILKTNKQSGAGDARNMAIANAQGEWLAILDADDVFLTDKLEKQMELIQKTGPDLVLVGSGCFHIDNLGRRSGTYNYPVETKSLKKNLLSWKRFPPHSSMLYRASAFSRTGGFIQKFSPAEDYDLWLRLSEIGDFACCSLPLIEYRNHSMNISSHSTNQGYTQIINGTAARVCQLLREAGCQDPSTAKNLELWNTLLIHVAETIQSNGYQDYLDWKNDCKKALLQSQHSFDKLGIISNAILRSPMQFIRLLREHAIGGGVANKCFDSWNKL